MTKEEIESLDKEVHSRCAQDHEAHAEHKRDAQADKWAGLLNIQKLQSIKPGGKEYRLVTLMALREAGERHHDLNGGDPDVSAKAAGHSKETKARYYKKVSYEEAQESYAKHHPWFMEEW